MTAQEQQMLQGLVERVNKTQLTDKDQDAERMLQSTLGQNPDALYILAQTVLVQGYALEQSQKQMASLRAEADQLRQQAQAPAKHTSFLGSLLGRDDEPARPVPPPPPAPAQAQYAPVPAYPPPLAANSPGAYGQPVAYGAPPTGQGGGFLRGAMQTAAGVAAGALAFEGVESLMHGFGHAAGYGTEFGPGFGGGGFGDSGPREEVINNYYGDTGSGEHSGSFPGDTNASGPDTGWSGTQDGQDNLAGFDDTGNSANDSPDATDSSDSTDSFDQGGDSSGFDDSSSGFDSGGDDSGGFDSGGGGDGF